MNIDEVRTFALSLAGTAEQPHHERTSFRVGGKIFATAPQDGSSVNIFVNEDSAHAAVAEFPLACSLLYWGTKLVGVTVQLSGAEPTFVFELLEEAWESRAK
jgi:hypothetical protein